MSPSEKSENVLLQLLQQGDHGAFEKLYEIYSRPLLAKLDKMLPDPEEANDILQELFIKVWERRDQINPELAFGGYLYRIGQRMVVDHYRKVARLSALHKEVKLTVDESANYTDEYLSGKETEQVLAAAVDLLPRQQKRAFQLCKMEGKSFKEAASIMNVSAETVHAHLVKANQTVRAYLKRSQHLPLSGSMALLMAVTQL